MISILMISENSMSAGINLGNLMPGAAATATVHTVLSVTADSAEQGVIVANEAIKGS